MHVGWLRVMVSKATCMTQEIQMIHWNTRENINPQSPLWFQNPKLFFCKLSTNLLSGKPDLKEHDVRKFYLPLSIIIRMLNCRNNNVFDCQGAAAGLKVGAKHTILCSWTPKVYKLHPKHSE